MKERPILFNGEMVRAILDGRKTQTRRVIKPQPPMWIESDRPGFSALGRGCPYGQPGDRLWVRETFAIVPRTAYAQSTGVDQMMRPGCDHDAAVFRADWERSAPGAWKPSIHMPRWASRIALEITAVRVERLQDISERDAWAEGCDAEDDDVTGGVSGYEHFSRLWISMNGPDSWDANPWVWVVEFRRIDTSQEVA